MPKIRCCPCPKQRAKNTTTHTRPNLSPSSSPSNAAYAMNVPVLARSRLRRRIRATLENIARVISSAHAEDETDAIFSNIDCAIITDTAEIIVAKKTSNTPFEAIAPKIRAMRTSASSLSNTVGCPTMDVFHVRSNSRMIHAYVIGRHTLVALTDVKTGSKNVDAVVSGVDRALCVSTDNPALIDQLSSMLGQL